MKKSDDNKKEIFVSDNDIKKYWRNFKLWLLFLVFMHILMFSFNGGTYYTKWPVVDSMFLIPTSLFFLLIGYYLSKIYGNGKILYVGIILAIIAFVIGKVLLPLWYVAGFFVIMIAKNKAINKLEQESIHV